MTKIHPPFDTRAMAAFLQVARDGSFTLAGSKLGMTPSAISKAIARLEADLGVTLFNRNPRSVSLTSAGLRFAAEAEQLALAIDRARNAVADPEAAIHDSLRVTLPKHFGLTMVAPHLPRFSERHPHLDIEYLLINGQLDPIEHGIDVAVWFSGGVWIDSRLVIQHVAAYDTMLCAAPAYLERNGTPRTIADLDQHRTLAGIDEKTGRIMSWGIHDGERWTDYAPRRRILSNGIELLYQIALDGGGIVYLPDYMAEEAIRLGRLRVVLPQYRLIPSDVQIAYPRQRSTAPGVAAFLALLDEIFTSRRAMPVRRLPAL